jgi:pyridoxal phosphate enzyme (YggS family)
MSDVSERIAAVRARIATACASAGRAPGSVRLLAVTKGVAAERVAEAVALGEVDLGENRVQEMLDKQAALPALLAARGVGPDRAPRWHMIGTLQRNKVRLVAGRVALIHGVDSPELAAEIGARAAALGGTQPVLVEVNASGETTKHGFGPRDAAAAARAAFDTPGVEFRGFMTIAAPGDARAARAAFAAVRALRDAVDFCDPHSLELSMGMSGDLEIAVEEGATIVRVGTALFGARPGR